MTHKVFVGEASLTLYHLVEMRRMGQAARDHDVTYFTAEKNYEQLLSIYHDAIDAVKTET